jgi:hypothetical protein
VLYIVLDDAIRHERETGPDRIFPNLYSAVALGQRRPS